MYKIYLDGQVLQNPLADLILSEPVLELAENTAGSFSFSIYPDHPLYSRFKATSRIDFYEIKNGIEKWIWSGRPTRIEDKFDLTRTVTAEGVLSWLADSIQSPNEYHDIPPADLLAAFLAEHNSQVEEAKRIKIGAVTVTDPNDSLFRYTNYETTLEAIQDKLVDRLGGILRLRKESDGFYLDYLKKHPRTSTQKIEFGQNLMDLFKENSFQEIGTILIPLGASLEDDQKDADFPQGLDQRITIRSVNNGSDALQSAEGVNQYGKIVRVHTWDDVHVPAILKQKAIDYLEVVRFESMTVTATAVDLSQAGIEIDDFEFLDRIICHSTPHNVDVSFPLREMRIYPLNPESNQYTLGTAVKTFSQSSAKAISEIRTSIEAKPSLSRVRQIAIDNATQILKQWAGVGYAIHTENESYFMDHPDKDQAVNVLRINMGGIGFSSTGIDGPYTYAWTLDGTFNTEFISAGSITADKIDVQYKNSVQQQINIAENNAKDDTDQKLQSYWTRIETQTEIQNKADEILLAAERKAKNMIDELATNSEGDVITALVNYYTKAQIDVKTDEILNTVESSRESLSNRFLGVYTKSEVDQLMDSFAVKVSEKTIVQTPNLIAGTQYWTDISVNAPLVDSADKEWSYLQAVSSGSETLQQLFTLTQSDIRFLPGNWYTLSMYTEGPANGEITLTMSNPKYEILEVQSPSGTASKTSSGNSCTLKAKPGQRITLFIKLGYRGLGIGNWQWDPFSFRYGTIPAGSTATTIKASINSTAGTYKVFKLQLERGKQATAYNAGVEDLTSRVAVLKVGLDNINMSVETKYQAAMTSISTGVNEAKALADTKAAQALADAKSDATAKANKALADAKADTTNRLQSYYTKSQIDIKEGSITQSVVDAKTFATSEASKALADAQTDATAKANKALADAKADTTEKLKSYYTKSQIDTSLENIRLSVETAKEYSDDKLKDYYSKSEIDAKTNSITQRVNEKIGSDEFSTMLQQSATDIQIAWNNISKYIQFSDASVQIYDSDNQDDQKLRMVFNDTGIWYYRDGYSVGWIGASYLGSDNSKKSLNFNLDTDGAYMCWAARESENSGSYTIRLMYVNKSFSRFVKNRIYLGCDLDTDGHSIINPDFIFEGSGYTPATLSEAIKVEGEGGRNIYRLKIVNGLVCN